MLYRCTWRAPTGMINILVYLPAVCFALDCVFDYVQIMRKDLVGNMEWKLIKWTKVQWALSIRAKRRNTSRRKVCNTRDIHTHILHYKANISHQREVHGLTCVCVEKDLKLTDYL